MAYRARLSALAALLLISCQGGGPFDGSPGASASRPTLIPLAPNLAEIAAYACGAEHLLARTSFADYPPAVASLPTVGASMAPDRERLLLLAPDHVLLPESAKGGLLAAGLQRLGLPLLFFRTETPVDIVLAVERLERLCGSSGKAASLRAELDLTAGAATPAALPLRVVFVQGRRPLSAAGPGSWGDALLHAAGLNNALGPGHRAYVFLSDEELGALDFDCLLDCSAAWEPGRLELEVTLPKDAAVIELRNNAILRPGPRFPQAVAELKSAALRCRQQPVQKGGAR